MSHYVEPVIVPITLGEITSVTMTQVCKLDPGYEKELIAKIVAELKKELMK